MQNTLDVKVLFWTLTVQNKIENSRENRVKGFVETGS